MYTIGDNLGFSPLRYFRIFISSVQAFVGSTLCRSLLKSSLYSSIFFFPCLRLSNWLIHLDFRFSVTNCLIISQVKVCRPPVHWLKGWYWSYHLFAAPFKYAGAISKHLCWDHSFACATSLKWHSHSSTSSSGVPEKKFGLVTFFSLPPLKAFKNWFQLGATPPAIA